MQESSFTRGQLILWGGILVVLLMISLIPLLIPHFHATVYEAPQEVDFTLPRAEGGDFQLSDYRGEVVVVYFGYTSCPDVCPTTLLDLHRTMEELEDQAGDVNVVFITVDPNNDTPEKMASYVSYFNPTFVGLVGSQNDLQTVYDLFGVRMISDEDTSRITHSDSVFVIDRKGRLRLRMHYGARPQDMAQDLRRLLREGGA